MIICHFTKNLLPIITWHFHISPTANNHSFLFMCTYQLLACRIAFWSSTPPSVPSKTILQWLSLLTYSLTSSISSESGSRSYAWSYLLSTPPSLINVVTHGHHYIIPSPKEIYHWVSQQSWAPQVLHLQGYSLISQQWVNLMPYPFHIYL